MQDEMNDLQMPYTDPAPGDLVRVVRCKDCKHFDPATNEIIIEWCSIWNGAPNPDGYCSYGERKDDK